MMATEKENMAMTAETREQKPSMATCKEALADYRITNKQQVELQEHGLYRT